MLLLLNFVIAIAGSLLKAHVINIGWTWFLFPVTGVAAPGLMAVLGILFMISLVVGVSQTYHYMSYKKEFDKEFNLTYTITGILLTLIIWFFMFLVQLAV